MTFDIVTIWQLGWHLNDLNDILTTWLTNFTIWLIFWQFDWHSDNLIDILTIWMTFWQFEWYFDNLNDILTIWLTFWQFDWHFDIIREISLDLDWSGEIWTDLGRSQQICWDLNRSGLTFTFWHLTLLTFDIASASKKKCCILVLVTTHLTCHHVLLKFWHNRIASVAKEDRVPTSS